MNDVEVTVVAAAATATLVAVVMLPAVPAAFSVICTCNPRWGWLSNASSETLVCATRKPPTEPQ